MIKEFCAENFTKIPQAIQKGANRIELCDNLAVGGTTPSTGVIEEVLARWRTFCTSDDNHSSSWRQFCL